MAYTYQLWENYVWMVDNEGDMHEFVEDLAAMWKKLLQKSDADLGIDAEYTRPGALALLQVFAEKLEDCDADLSFRFQFD